MNHVSLVTAVVVAKKAAAMDLAVQNFGEFLRVLSPSSLQSNFERDLQR